MACNESASVQLALASICSCRATNLLYSWTGKINKSGFLRSHEDDTRWMNHGLGVEKWKIDERMESRPREKFKLIRANKRTGTAAQSFYLLSQKQIVFVSLGGVHPTDGWGKVFSFNLFLAEKAQRRKLQWTPSRLSRAYQGILREGKLFPPTASRQWEEWMSQGSSR